MTNETLGLSLLDKKYGLEEFSQGWTVRAVALDVLSVILSTMMKIQSPKQELAKEKNLDFPENSSKNNECSDMMYNQIKSRFNIQS